MNIERSLSGNANAQELKTEVKQRSGSGVGEGNISEIVRQARKAVPPKSESPHKDQEEAIIERVYESNKVEPVRKQKKELTLEDSYATTSNFLNEKTLGNIRLLPIDFNAPNVVKLFKPKF